MKKKYPHKWENDKHVTDKKDYKPKITLIQNVKLKHDKK